MNGKVHMIENQFNPLSVFLWLFSILLSAQLGSPSFGLDLLSKRVGVSHFTTDIVEDVTVLNYIPSCNALCDVKHPDRLQMCGLSSVNISGKPCQQ